MSYEQFKEEFFAEIEMRVMDEGLNIDVNSRKVMKTNGIELDSIILKDESNIAPVVYVNDMYEAFQDGTSMEELVTRAIEISREEVIIQDFDSEDIKNWEKIKNKIIFQVVGEKENQALLNTAPLRMEQDMFITYRVVINQGEGTAGSYRIDNVMKSNLGVSENDLYKAAIQNMPRLFPPEIMDMTQLFDTDILINQNISRDLDKTLHDMEKGVGMYVLSNSDKYFGAGTIFYPEVMNKIAMAFDTDMVVLPSSVHEMILLPYTEDMEISNLKAMVTEVNATHVRPEEKLNDQVYIYDKVEQKLMIGDTWISQKLDKSMRQKSIKETLKEKKKQVVSTPIKKPLDVNAER